MTHGISTLDRSNYKGEHVIRVEGVGTFSLPKIEIAPGVVIAFFNLLHQPVWAQRCAYGLIDKLRAVVGNLNGVVFVTPEVKSIPLVHELAVRLSTTYYVLRKEKKDYMCGYYRVLTTSITSPGEHAFYLCKSEAVWLRRTRVVLVDDVISTGSTMLAMRRLMDRLGAVVVAEVAVFSEGPEVAACENVIVLGHLPVWKAAE